MSLNLEISLKLLFVLVCYQTIALYCMTARTHVAMFCLCVIIDDGLLYSSLK